MPTFDHGLTLTVTLETVLAQTLRDFELFVIGDGSPAITGEVMSEFCARDERIRYLEFPKGRRTGEEHRPKVLSQARGRFIAYLCDDDLWHPSHLEQLVGLLAEADLAHTLPVAANPDGTFHVWTVDLALPAYRRLLLDVENRVPLSFVGHTMDFYRALPRGWEVTPAGVPTDLHFYRQCLSMPSCRAVSGGQLTGLHLPATERGDMSPQARVDELRHWADRIERDWWDISGGVLAAVVRDRALLEGPGGEEQVLMREELSRMAQYVEHAQGRLVHFDSAVAQSEQVIQNLTGLLEAERQTGAGLRRQLEVQADESRQIQVQAGESRVRQEASERCLREAREELAAMRQTVTWRLHDRLLRGRGGRLARSAIRRLAGPR